MSAASVYRLCLALAWCCKANDDAVMLTSCLEPNLGAAANTSPRCKQVVDDVTTLLAPIS